MIHCSTHFFWLNHWLRPKIKKKHCYTIHKFSQKQKKKKKERTKKNWRATVTVKWSEVHVRQPKLSMIWLSFKNSQTMQVIAAERIGFMRNYYFIKGLLSLQNIVNVGLLYCSVKTSKDDYFSVEFFFNWINLIYYNSLKVNSHFRRLLLMRSKFSSNENFNVYTY